MIADWSPDGSIDGRYPESCYRQAMLNAPTDLKIYSTLENDLQNALHLRSAHRLSTIHERVTSLNVSGGSSIPFLAALIAGFGILLAGCSIVATLVRRRG